MGRAPQEEVSSAWVEPTYPRSYAHARNWPWPIFVIRGNFIVNTRTRAILGFLFDDVKIILGHSNKYIENKILYSLLQTLIFINEYSNWLYQIATNTVPCVYCVSQFICRKTAAFNTAMKCIVCMFLWRRNANRRALLLSWINWQCWSYFELDILVDCASNATKKRRILTFLRKYIAVDFYLRRQESVLQVDTSRAPRAGLGSISVNVNGTTEVGWARINQCECKRYHWGGPGPDRARHGSTELIFVAM